MEIIQPKGCYRAENLQEENHMKREMLLKVLSLAMALLMLLGSMTVVFAAEGTDGTQEGAKEDKTVYGAGKSPFTSSSIEEVQEILSELSYEEYLEKYVGQRADGEIVIKAADYFADATTADVSVQNGVDGRDNVLLTPETGVTAWKVNVPKDAYYELAIDYYADAEKTTSVERLLRVDGVVPYKEARYLVLNKTWVYILEAGETFIQDINGNELRPAKAQKPGWSTYTMCDSTGSYNGAFTLYLTEGEHVITLESTRNAVTLDTITLKSKAIVPNYSAVKSGYAAKGYKSVSSDATLKIQAEYPSAMSDQSIFPVSDRTSSITEPQDPSKIRLNTIGGSNWKTVGQWIEWTVVPSETGLYKIAARFEQNFLNGMFVSRKLTINGELPFEEAEFVSFNYDSGWQTAFLGADGEDYEFYFEANKSYTIRLEVNLGGIADILRDVQSHLATINNIYLKIIQLTGLPADSYRDYKFYQHIPETIDQMIVEEKALYEISDELTAFTGEKGSQAATLDEVAYLLGRMGRDEDEIAKSLTRLKTLIGSLGTWLNNCRAQGLLLDYLQLQGTDEALPKANASFLQALGFELKMFFASFVTDYNTLGAMQEIDEDNSIEVWMATGRDQSQIVRQMINDQFTPESGIAVNLKLVAANTLLPATLSGVGPDVSMFEIQSHAVNYAIRGAVNALNDYNGFDEVAARFDESALMPLTLYGKTYALPDTQSFYMMFYRKDIFADLGIDVPKTWDDLKAVLPVLQSKQMLVGLPKELMGLLMFLYQKDGELYADEGMRINLDSNVALDAFKELCDLFNQYSLKITYDFQNYFRSGEMPLAIVPYEQHIQLSVFATEIRGLWEFVTIPGTPAADGTLNCASPSTVTESLMMSATKNPEASWEYMKWWTSAGAQARYGNDLVTVMGSSQMHPTANIEALSEMSWSTTDYANLMNQFDNLVGTPEFPGGYIITRYVSFAFLETYNDDADPVMSIQKYINTINKEITRKRKEFGYETLEIGQTLDEKRQQEAQS